MSESNISTVMMRLTQRGASVKIESRSDELGPILNKAFRCAHDAMVETMRSEGFSEKGVAAVSDYLVAFSLKYVGEALPPGSFWSGKWASIIEMFKEWDALEISKESDNE